MNNHLKEGHNGIDPIDEINALVDFKIKPILIPSSTIKKLEMYPHGAGGIGDVWKCSMSTASGMHPVAVKIIRTPQSDDKELLYRAGRRIRQEAYVWIQLSHDYILPFEGIIDDLGSLPALVSLWMENGSLNEYLKHNFPQLSDWRKSGLIQQVAAGLSYLHGKDVVHGDLTGTNILIDDSGNIRIADFSLSMLVAESGNLTFGSLHSGNTRWIAPEFVKLPDDSDEPQLPLKPTKTGDIYSFGCIMLQLFNIPLHPSACGGYGDVWKCDLKKDGNVVKVAAKAIRRQGASDEDALKKALKRGKRELEVWLKLRHDHVLPLYGVAHEFGPGTTVMVCPWLENGTVTSFIASRCDLGTRHRLQLISDVADGLRYLHSQSIVHGDLTGVGLIQAVHANILVCAQGMAHLADFGLSIILEEHDMVSYSVTGAARWAAPELFTDEAPGDFLSLQSDMYSFGSIMFQILSGVIPYHKLLRNNQVIGAIIKGGKPPRPEDPQTQISDLHWNFIQECWLPIERRYSRPSANDAYDFLQYECGLIFESTMLLL
ncbi:kinase-like protein [Rhizopogon vinicolor AM-OR11-026]|uniref:Kinase-like protein n=1 Tax=Rhizopogon vinicolor AM-OR11-026 TaxID=1314800 RepID=A0A1B7MKF3_9AGAM|nr:kinase-like protein [Rhizopogon vinicolor AM-OR11-026]